jgi:hypothetical protein
MQRRRGRFGGAGGKNDLTGVIGAKQGGDLLMRTLQRPARGQTKVMNRRRVAVMFGQKRHHRLQHHRVDTGGGVIIEINLFHLYSP